MAHGFGDDKGKVDIDAILTQLQTNFQNNINTIYNTIVNKGITPTAKTPTAIASGINSIVSTIYNAIVAQGVTPTAQTTTAINSAIGTLATNKFNAGKAAAEAVTWVVKMNASALSAVNFTIENVEHVVSILNTSSMTISYECYDSTSSTALPISSGTVANNGYVPIASGTKRIVLINDNSATFVGVSVDVTYQAKAVR